MTWLALLLTTAGFALFGLSNEDHHRRRRGMAPSAPRVRWLRRGGWAALALSFPPAIAALGWVYGPILWVGLLMLGAGLVFIALNFIPAPRARQ